MVQFGNPAALWLLLLIIPLVLLYLLKRKRREVIVPSTLLWKQVLEDLRVQTPFQKLRSSLLLLLQILAVVLVTAILAQPHLLQTATQFRRWVLVLDASASMQATDEKPNRFSVARNKLAEFIQRLPEGDEVLLLILSKEAAILQTFTTDRNLLESKIRTVQAEDLPGNWDQLGMVLKPLLKETVPPQVVIASDFSDSPSQLEGEISFQAIHVGNSPDNAAITKATVQPFSADPARQDIFYQVQNYDTAPKRIEIEIKSGNELRDAFEVTLGPGEGSDRHFQTVVENPTTIGIHLNVEDRLAVDNDYTLALYPLEKIGVNLRMQDPFLERALKVLPRVRLQEDAEIRIGDELPQENIPGIFFLRGEKDQAGPVVQWNTGHPVFRFVDAGLWRFHSYRVLELPAAGRILLESEAGSIAYAKEENGRRILALGFIPKDSNVVLLAGFPIFLQNALEWIDESFHRQLPAETSLLYRKEGPIELNNKKGFVNFADRQESKIRPQHLRGREITQAQSFIRKKDVSNWLLLLLIGVVILEWWVFHRRIE